MSKRKAVDLELNYLKKKKEEIDRRMSDLDKARESCAEADSESSAEEDVTPEYRPSDDDSDTSSEKAEENKEDKEALTVTEQDTANNSEKPLNSCLKLALGDDPNESKAQKLFVHSKLIAHWQYYTTNGLTKDERTQLLKKFEIPEGLTAPVLNEQIQAKLSEKAVKRDEYRYEVQRSASAALTALSAAISMINDADENGLDPDEFTDKLVDAARLMSDIQYRQTETRKAFIVPRFSKSFQDILKKAKPGRLLFGSDLPTKIKEFKDTDKLFENTTVPGQPKYQIAGRPSGNFKRPLEPKPPSNAAGNSYTGGQGKQRLFFRRYPNQRGGRKRNHQGQRPPMQPLAPPKPNQ